MSTSSSFYGLKDNSNSSSNQEYNYNQKNEGSWNQDNQALNRNKGMRTNKKRDNNTTKERKRLYNLEKEWGTFGQIEEVEEDSNKDARKDSEDKYTIVERKSFKGMGLELYGNKQNNDIEDGTKQILEGMDMKGWEEIILNHNIVKEIETDDIDEQETFSSDNYKENLIQKENEDMRFFDSFLIRDNHSKDNYFENEEDKRFLESITQNKNIKYESEEK
ncbi:hypothetical protein K502DRAFT_346216 [Neoconidiobolus thromboides FSU 785]|nr:hypothetical protein K502DRAFT_346216 [Neoconidiobolus thromboides FSU 785]